LPAPRQQSEHLRIVLFELTSRERIEIIGAKERFRRFSKVLSFTGGRVCALSCTIISSEGVVDSRPHDSLEGGRDLHVIETQNLIVIYMGEFMEDHHWYPLSLALEDRRVCELAATLQFRMPAPFFEPAGIGVIFTGRSDSFVFWRQPDLHRP